MYSAISAPVDGAKDLLADASPGKELVTGPIVHVINVPGEASVGKLAGK